MNHQMKIQNDQLMAQNDELKNQVYKSFVNDALGLDQLIIQYPEYRKYALGDAPIPDTMTEEEIARLFSIEEYIIDSLENVHTYLDKIPESQRETWIDYEKTIKATTGYKYYMKHAKHHWYDNSDIHDDLSVVAETES